MGKWEDKHNSAVPARLVVFLFHSLSWVANNELNLFIPKRLS